MYQQKKKEMYDKVKKRPLLMEMGELGSEISDVEKERNAGLNERTEEG